MKRQLIFLTIMGLVLAQPCLEAGSDGTKDQGMEQAKAILPVFDLDFPGGTPAELVKAIEKAQGTVLNAILPSEAESYSYPSMHIRSVTAEDIFNAISNRSLYLINTVEGYSVQSTWKSNNPREPGAIWVLDVVDIEHWKKMKGGGVKVYSLEPILEEAKYKVEDITYAIKSAWEMAGIVGKVDMKFHEETGLLIVRGDNQAIQMLEQVLESLQPRRNPESLVQQIGPNPDSLRIEAERRLEIQRAEQDLKKQIQKLREMERLAALREEEVLSKMKEENK